MATALRHDDSTSYDSVPEAAGLPAGRRWGLVVRNAFARDAILIVLGLCFLSPVVWLLDAAFSPHASSSLTAPSLSLVNFRAAVQAGAGHSLLNSLYLAGVSTIIATFVSTLAGYVLSRHHVPAKRSLLVGVLFLTGLPVVLLLIPIYQIFVKVGWLNSPFYTSLVLAATSVPFAIWLLKNFIDQVPRELEEAAAIEGASEPQILLRVVVPLIMPGMMVAAILSFINAWGAFLLPLVLDANPNNTPGAVAIYEFITANGRVQFGPLAAFAVLFSVPVIVLYLISSRWLKGGFAFAGGVKG